MSKIPITHQNMKISLYLATVIVIAIALLISKTLLFHTLSTFDSIVLGGIQTSPFVHTDLETADTSAGQTTNTETMQHVATALSNDLTSAAHEPFSETNILDTVTDPTNIPPAQTRTIYHGAFPDFGGTEDVVTTAAITEFESLAGKNIAFASFSDNWLYGISFPSQAVTTITEQGIVPLIRIMPRSTFQKTKTDPEYSLQQIINGEFDTELIAWAEDARDTNTPLLVTFAPEMNGNWFSWAGKHNGAGTENLYGDPNYPDGPERYRDAFRHIIDLFQEQGANNISWIFQTNATRQPNREWNSAQYYYPGDDYIDWLGTSVYGATTTREPVNDFDAELTYGYTELIAVSPDKPIMISEFGITERSEKAHWISTALTSLINNAYPNIQAISYWHENWGTGNKRLELRLDSSNESLKAYQTLIQDSIFVETLSIPLP